MEAEIRAGGPESTEAIGELRKAYERRQAQSQFIAELKEQLKEPKRQADELQEFLQGQEVELVKLKEEREELSLVLAVLHSELSELHVSKNS